MAKRPEYGTQDDVEERLRKKRNLGLRGSLNAGAGAIPPVGFTDIPAPQGVGDSTAVRTISPAEREGLRAAQLQSQRDRRGGMQFGRADSFGLERQPTINEQRARGGLPQRGMNTADRAFIGGVLAPAAVLAGAAAAPEAAGAAAVGAGGRSWIGNLMGGYGRRLAAKPFSTATGTTAGLVGTAIAGKIGYDAFGRASADAETKAIAAKQAEQLGPESAAAPAAPLYIEHEQQLGGASGGTQRARREPQLGTVDPKTGLRSYGQADVEALKGRTPRMIGESDPAAYSAGMMKALGTNPREVAQLGLRNPRYDAQVAGAQAINAGTQARTQRYSASDFGAPDAEEMTRRFNNLTPEEQAGEKGALIKGQIGLLGRPKDPNASRFAAQDASRGLRDMIAADRNSIEREKLGYQREKDVADRESKEHLAFQDNLRERLSQIEDPQDQLAYLGTTLSELQANDVDWDTSDQGMAVMDMIQQRLPQDQVTGFLQLDRSAALGDKFYDKDLSDFSVRKPGITETGNVTFNEPGAKPAAFEVPDNLAQAIETAKRKQEERRRANSLRGK